MNLMICLLWRTFGFYAIIASIPAEGNMTCSLTVEKRCLLPLSTSNSFPNLTITEPFENQIASLNGSVRSAACVAVAEFRKCVLGMIEFCPPSSDAGMAKMVQAATYVSSSVYIDQCLNDTLCGPDSFGCVAFGSLSCARNFFACDGEEYCDDGVDESTTVCGCDANLASTCFEPFSRSTTVFPPFHLPSPLSSQLLFLSELGAELVCSALANASSCFAPISGTCKPGFANLQDKLDAFHFTNSSFYFDFCIQKKRNLPKCNTTAVQVCLDTFSNKSGSYIDLDIPIANQMAGLSGNKTKTVCSSFVDFSTCFDPLENNCKYSQNAALLQALRLAAAKTSTVYEEICLGITCGDRARTTCSEELKASFFSSVSLHLNESFSSQIAITQDKDRDDACTLTVKFKKCVETAALSCSLKDPAIQNLTAAASFVGSSVYKDQCLFNASCPDDQMACRLVWGKGCVSDFFICDGASFCDDGLDEANCGNGNATTSCSLNHKTALQSCMAFLTTSSLLDLSKPLEAQFSSLNASLVDKFCSLIETYVICVDPYLPACLNSKDPAVQVAVAINSVQSFPAYHQLCRHNGTCDIHAFTDCFQHYDLSKPSELCGYLSCVKFNVTGCNLLRIPPDIISVTKQYDSQCRDSGCNLVVALSCLQGDDLNNLECDQISSRIRCLEQVPPSCRSPEVSGFGNITELLASVRSHYEKECGCLTQAKKFCFAHYHQTNDSRLYCNAVGCTLNATKNCPSAALSPEYAHLQSSNQMNCVKGCNIGDILSCFDRYEDESAKGLSDCDLLPKYLGCFHEASAACSKETRSILGNITEIYLLPEAESFRTNCNDDCNVVEFFNCFDTLSSDKSTVTTTTDGFAEALGSETLGEDTKKQLCSSAKSFQSCIAPSESQCPDSVLMLDGKSRVAALQSPGYKTACLSKAGILQSSFLTFLLSVLVFLMK
eukprot:m.144735 g.144735  ORF g.144735 m.144735 type:complete len:947 (+) comp38405_c0_seq2:216-3056(+)